MHENFNTESLSEAVGSDVTDWNARYLAGNTPWDHQQAHPALLFWLSKNKFSGEILVPGCGKGADACAIAKTGVPVLGIDIAPEAIRYAKQLHSTAHFQVRDIFALPKKWHKRFAGAFEHTCYCAIPPQKRRDYVRTLASVIQTGGCFLAIFYIHPTPQLSPPFPTHRAELDRLLNPYFQLEWEMEPSLIYPEALVRQYSRTTLK